jgi:short-chain fatty acids transporter
VLLGAGWLVDTFATQGPLTAISNLNTHNFLFPIVGLLLHWQPRRFLHAVARAVPATTGALIQFPFYAGIAAILTGAKNPDGTALSDWLAHVFVSVSTQQQTLPYHPPVVPSGKRSALLITGDCTPNAGAVYHGL